MKKILLFIVTILLFSCSTIQFGTRKNEYLFDQDEQINDIKEYDLSYQYKVMGVKVKGDKTIVEDVFFHPTKKAVHFIAISFPKIGILTTHDEGKTFTAHFINSGYLNDAFGYSTSKANDDENKNSSNQRIIPKRIFCHFAVSENDPKKIVISYGQVILLSTDCGATWIEKKVFYNINNSIIKNILIDKNDTVLAFSNTGLAVSNDWGKKWKTHQVHLPGLAKTEYYKTKFVDAIYDASFDAIYGSFVVGEKDSTLASRSYNYLYKDKTERAKSGLFYSNDLGKTWIKSDINEPVVLWNYNNNLYGASIYPLSLYSETFSKKFKDSPLYRYGILNDKSSEALEYVNALLKQQPEDYAILSMKNNRIIVFENGVNKHRIIKAGNLDLILPGICKLQNLEYIQWDDSVYFEKRSSNFFYEYNFWRMYKIWTGMRTNSPTLYYKDSSTDIYYRTIMNPIVYKPFVKYVVKNQLRINSINPFLKKESDVEFFDPSFDPTNGVPFLLEKSIDKGKHWKAIAETEHIKNMLDPLSNKRSAFFWYKNVDKKKYFKFQLSFGFGKEANLFVYPQKLAINCGNLLVQINYFSIINSYKDMYLFPVK